MPNIKYNQNNITLHLQDCIEWMQSVDSDSIDMTLTSPPYDKIRNYEGYSFDFESTAKELYRITKPGGVVIWNVADQTVNGSETCTSMKQALYFVECGFKLHDTMIYLKKNPMPSSGKRYHQSWEYIFCFSKGVPNTFNPIEVECKYANLNANQKYRGVDGKKNYKVTKRNAVSKVKNVFEYIIGGGHTTKDKIAFEHPAIMPEKLAEDQIKTWTNEGDVVIDPFAGSGTTAKMCLMNHRKFYGCEISEEYCNIFIKRLEQFETKLIENPLMMSFLDT
jgi:site-specific DNA-methyltransferase (adenine-specific)